MEKIVKKIVNKAVSTAKTELEQKLETKPSKEEMETKMEERLHSFGIDLLKIFVTKDEFHTEMTKLGSEIATREQMENLMKSNDQILQKLNHHEVEYLASLHRMERYDETFGNHEQRIQKLEGVQ